jgi:quercetin dioxygenase-like cupin family protein
MRLKENTMKSTKRLLVGGGLGLALLGVLAYASTTTILGVGALPYSELVNGPAELTMRQFISQPGEEGGWHYHPGLVFNVVTSGTVIVEDGCGGEEAFSAGQAFEKIGGRVHRWKNHGAVPAVEFNTFVVPQGSPLAVSLPERRCGPPRSVSECRHNGWQAFTHPRNFMNQGDCIQFVRRER